MRCFGLAAWRQAATIRPMDGISPTAPTLAIIIGKKVRYLKYSVKLSYLEGEPDSTSSRPVCIAMMPSGGG